MKTILQLVIAAFVIGLFTSPVYAADAEWSKVYKACEKDAEKNEVEFDDLRTFIKGCMTDAGISSADADSTLDELSAPANTGDKEDS